MNSKRKISKKMTDKRPTVLELRKLLKQKGLKVSGNKPELLERLKKAQKSTTIKKKSKIKKLISFKSYNQNFKRNSKKMTGKIYIASMNMRGKWAECPDVDLKLNVTSMQSKTNKNRRDFSPMTEHHYKGFYNFEAYWQSRRVYSDIPYETSLEFWKNIKKPTRRYPNSKGKKVLWSRFLDDDTTHLNYIESRTKIYVPEYTKYIHNTEMLKYWKSQYQNGKTIVIYDFDGPRLKDNTPTCLELTKELLIAKINDPTFPFGHGYIVGASILGIKPEEYI